MKPRLHNTLAPRVVVDGRCSQTGIGRYVSTLLSIAQRQNEWETIQIVQTRTAPQPRGVKNAVIAAPIYSLREQWLVPWAARGADLVHIPHYNIPVFYPGKLLVTIHDLTHITVPEFARSLKSRIYARNMLGLAVKKASHIVTDTHFVARQIQERWHLPKSKITTIYLNVGSYLQPRISPGQAGELMSQMGVSVPYYLYVGGFRPHKNLPLLLRGFKEFLRQKNWPGYLLLVSTDAKGLSQVLREAERLRIADRIQVKHQVTDEQLIALYMQCHAFVTASLSEGFCLPVLEAMTCGAPVACSQATCLPEIAGGAALLFDARNPEAIASSLADLLEPNRRNYLVRAGRERAAWFSAQDPAARHLTLYRELLATF